jgi:CubicO group peptidase (beta-lactamase class C family)
LQYQLRGLGFDHRKVTELSYEAMKEMIFTPLGMNDTVFEFDKHLETRAILQSNYAFGGDYLDAVYGDRIFIRRQEICSNLIWRAAPTFLKNCRSNYVGYNNEHKRLKLSLE